MMNLPQFLKTVDQTTSQMPKDHLAAFIHDIARTLPEREREDFLTRLNSLYGTPTETESPPKPQAADRDFSQKQKSLKTQLERIESWELSLEGCLNQDYDDWYDSAEEEFQYSDPEGVLDIIEEACRFVHLCVDCEEYEVACEFTDILIGLGIMEGNHRNYYGECAAYIAALGEAKESGGEKNGKQATMVKYMELYTRRRTFREEMQRYGMKDYKKKK